MSDAIAGDDAHGGKLADLAGDLGAVIDGGVIGEASARNDRGAARDDNAHGIGQGGVDGIEQNGGRGLRAVAAATGFSLPRFASAAEKPNSVFNGVRIGCITYSYRSMAKTAEETLKALGLTYRVKLLATGDTGFCARMTYDLEVWAPGCQEWLEVSSILSLRSPPLCTSFSRQREIEMFSHKRNAFL